MKIINIDVIDKIDLKNIEDTESETIKILDKNLSIPANNYNNILLNFNFVSPDATEDGLHLFAIFSADFLKKPIEVEITEIEVDGKLYKTACLIPAETLQKKGNITLGIYGYVLNDDDTLNKRISLTPIVYTINTGSYREDAVEGIIPTPTVFEVYFNNVANTNAQMETNYKEYNENINELFNNANQALKKVKHFNSVAEMKEDNTLVAGYVVNTLGYYSANDGGGSTYLIRAKLEEDIEDNGLIHFLENGLVAVLINGSDFIDIKILGVKIDGTDETEKINNILSSNKNIIFSVGIYTISDTLNLISNSNILLENATIHSLSSENKKYIFNIDALTNVYIKSLNSTLKFDKPSQNQQANIRISKSQNINIEGLSLVGAGGDGIIISGNNENVTSDINIINCKIDNSRRNGISLIGGIDGLKIKKCNIINTSGAVPQAGIDIETWDTTLFNKNIIIEENTFKNNASAGVIIFECTDGIYLRNNTFNDSLQIKTNADYNDSIEYHPQNVNVENNIFYSSVYCYNIHYSTVNIINNTFHNRGVSIEGSIIMDNDKKILCGSKNIINNIFNNSETAIYFSQQANINILNNVINNVKKRPFSFGNSFNMNVRNNFVNGYKTVEDDTLTNCCYINKCFDVLFEDNTIIKNSNTLNVNTLISVIGSCENVFIRRNNIKNALYTNAIYYALNTSGICHENLTNENKEYSTNNIPPASAFYCGTIITFKNSAGIYKNYLCVHNGTDYVWKQIAFVE